MRFGTNHAFQLPPGHTVAQVYAEEFERIRYADELGYHSVWLPEQHFFDYCICPDALDLAAYVVAATSRVRVGTAVVNLSLTHPLRFAARAAMLDLISGGRVDICVGRGYQLPQNVAFGVDELSTKPMFTKRSTSCWTHGRRAPADTTVSTIRSRRYGRTRYRNGRPTRSCSTGSAAPRPSKRPSAEACR